MAKTATQARWLEVNFGSSRHRQIQDVFPLVGNFPVLLYGQQDMRRPATIGDENRAAFCGFLGFACVLMEFTAGKRSDGRFPSRSM